MTTQTPPPSPLAPLRPSESVQLSSMSCFSAPGTVTRPSECVQLSAISRLGVLRGTFRLCPAPVRPSESVQLSGKSRLGVIRGTSVRRPAPLRPRTVCTRRLNRAVASSEAHPGAPGAAHRLHGHPVDLKFLIYMKINLNIRILARALLSYDTLS